MPPSAEEFARWRDDYVTRWVTKAFEEAAEANRLSWLDLSWTGGSANQPVLSELRTRADAYLALRDTAYEAFCEMNGEEPLRD